MTKFHINKHGVPAPCKAKAGNCPLGGSEQHFDNIEEAQAYVDNQSEERHGLLPGVKGEKKVNKEITGDSYDSSLIDKDRKAPEVDLRMKEVGNGIEEGFVLHEKDAFDGVAEGYDKNLVKPTSVPEVDLTMTDIGDGEEEGFI